MSDAPQRGELVLVRHGTTEWSASGRHTGRTDVPLTDLGEKQAQLLAEVLAERHFALVLSSPLQRARRTAELAGLAGAQLDPNLQEWDYGRYEGLTTPQIREQRPGWLLWRDGVPAGDGDHPGETIADVARRADAVIARSLPALGDGDVALVAHGHFLRVLAARWLGLEPVAGALLALDTASISMLGFEHDEHVIRHWNLTPAS